MSLVIRRTTPEWDTPTIWEYQLLVQLDKTVSEKVMEEKEHFLTVYGQEPSIETQSQILVTRFSAPEQMEPTLLRWLQKVCNNQPRFVTVLNNFSGFPPHTIYLRVQHQQPYKELAKGLKTIEQYVCSNDCPPMHLPPSPHLAIASSLTEDIYENAIKEYAGRLFHACFSVDNLLLMKRRNQREAFQHVSLIPLAAQPNNLFN